MVKHYVEFVREEYDSTLWGEMTRTIRVEQLVQDRDASKLEWPAGFYICRFYDRDDICIWNDVRLNTSGNYYRVVSVDHELCEEVRMFALTETGEEIPLRYGSTVVINGVPKTYEDLLDELEGI
jgi:hypothetical protein